MGQRRTWYICPDERQLAELVSKLALFVFVRLFIFFVTGSHLFQQPQIPIS